ncbi:hypothetical protein [Enterovirga aerilata]|uniref:Uncharacterized protein n=1 Tax=Enterovirga aerilata TaxID=2730920 RepID=A0A849I9Y9_9HYPH|nr:hypothetical protein [Enterovirga sp. DB1703]NNM74664.1 hypothetical protein [Enterovirga sp. DB1703]
MADQGKTDNLKSFDAYRDENGQFMGQDAPTDLARPGELQRRLNSDPGWEAETARVASGRPRLDSVEGGSIETSDQTAAETPPENIARISDAAGDAGGPKLAGESPAAKEAIERATSGLGKA